MIFFHEKYQRILNRKFFHHFQCILLLRFLTAVQSAGSLHFYLFTKKGNVYHPYEIRFFETQYFHKDQHEHKFLNKVLTKLT